MASAISLQNARDPNADNANFRSALGCFATGVTIVTCRDGLVPKGIVANSFASVSLAPPLVLWSPAKASRRYAAFIAAQAFSIHILAQDQKHLSDAFAHNETPFDTLEWYSDARGVPVLSKCLARFDCHLHGQYDGGDHTILLGHVDHYQSEEGAPLIFSQGAYQNGV
ncbi:flavin reductase family protein [Rhodobacteraceae bacterium]|nr:flavin reductase family protein [Paracoccaceae bacterium]